MPEVVQVKIQVSYMCCTLQALVECEGDSIDLSGDVGSVGRIVISDDSSKKPEMFLDLKGMQCLPVFFCSCTSSLLLLADLIC